MPRTRLKIGGTIFNRHLEDAQEATRRASLATQATLQTYEADALTGEVLLAHLLRISTELNTILAQLHEMDTIIQANV